MNVINCATDGLKNADWGSMVGTWVAAAAITGAVISGGRKACQIAQEPEPKFRNEFVEKPLRGVYHTTRIASHVGAGACIAGGVALTAPVSIPFYVYWRREYDRQTPE